MLFNSFEYLIFLPFVFILYWFVFKKLRWQNLLIVVASYVFYGWWDYRFLILIAFTTLCSFFSALLVEKQKSKGLIGGGKLLTICNIAINLLILGVFKYFNFFAESFTQLFKCLGFIVHPITLNLILPVGISFYTFQALSYTIDVYRGKMVATRDIVSFVAFISFFPQLVAGPIERATNLLPQFQRERKFDYSLAVEGMRQILWGLFKKMVVADNCADVVDSIWLNYSQHSALTLVITAVAFSFQIYGDFSGYSDIAIGTGKLFGIRLMNNFNLPYFSRSVAEFWKRWHISLNTWFVDYVYIPLGGSRDGKWKSVRNTFIIFLLSGLWHGANWTYVTWGVYHAALFIPLVKRKFNDVIAKDSIFPNIKELGRMLLTFATVVFGWIIFRASSITDFCGYCSSIIYNVNVSEELIGKKAIFFIGLLLSLEWVNRKREQVFYFPFKNMVLRWSVYLLFVFLCIAEAGKQVQFIYFQF